MPDRVSRQVNRMPWGWIVALLISASLVMMPYKLANDARHADVARCEAGATGAEAAGGAIQAIIDGNERIANDPFQSKVTQEAREDENAQLQVAVDYYNERAELDCGAAYPKPDLVPF